MDVRTFGVRAMECMCAQFRFALTSERVWREWSQNPCLLQIPSAGKFSSGEDRTHDAASSRTASPTRYQRDLFRLPVIIPRQNVLNSLDELLAELLLQTPLPTLVGEEVHVDGALPARLAMHVAVLALLHVLLQLHALHPHLAALVHVRTRDWRVRTLICHVVW